MCVFVVFTSLCWRGKLVKWVRKVRERQIKEEGVTNQVGSASWLAVRVLTGSSSRDALRDQHHCRWGWEPSGCSGRFPPPEGAISLLLLEAGPLHPEHRWTASVWRKEHLYHLWQYIQTKNFNYVLRTKAISIFFSRNIRFKQLTKWPKIFKLKWKRKIKKIIKMIFDFSWPILCFIIVLWFIFHCKCHSNQN